MSETQRFVGCTCGADQSPAHALGCTAISAAVGVTGHGAVPPHHGDARARVLKEVAPRVGQLRAQAALHPDAHVDCGLVRETIALLQSLLPTDPAADKQAQVDMANEHHARADRADRDQSDDLEAIRFALFTGLKSRAKSAAQEAFLRITKIVAAVDTLNTWITQPSERGVRRGLMYRVWDTGRGDVVVELFNDQAPHPCDKFQSPNANDALADAATAVREGTVLR